MHHVILVYVLGDVHADFGRLNAFISKRIRSNRAIRELAADCESKNHDFQILILQCGDFAYFWTGVDFSGAIRNQVDFLPGGRLPVYWCAGNHEDWDKLDSFVNPRNPCAKIVEVDAGLYYCPFASTLTLAPGLTVLFAGGAESGDKDYRLAKMREKGCLKIWWEQEGISESDMARLNCVQQTQWVVSHTAPAAFNLAQSLTGSYKSNAKRDIPPSRKFLDTVLRRFRPRRWFFGHFHHGMASETDGCKWLCLDQLGGAGSFWFSEIVEYDD